MKSFLKILLVLSLLMLQVGPVLSQTPDVVDDLVDNWKRAGQAAMPFLRFGAGARMMGMADAGLTVRGDAAALFYNPAGIAYVQGGSVMLSNMDWLMDTSIMTGAIAYNLGALGTVGISAMFYDYGDPIQATVIDETQAFGYRDVGTFEPSEYVIGFGYGREISAQFAIGGQVKLAYQDLLGGDVQTGIAYQKADGSWQRDFHDATQTSLAFDFGTMYDTGFRSLTLSMSIRNFGREVIYEQERFDLPLSFRIGLGADVFNLLNMQQDGQALGLYVDWIHPRDWDERVNTGLEYGFNDMFFLRGGYKYNYTSEGLVVGGGVKVELPMGLVRIDYAYKDTKDTLFDAVHVYSLNLGF
ncbi:PorV/PorQ family protein [candidate division KSB1 bacterium]|nr:PorV/PorQ family protein [candidate division KSB1 bacterium]